MPLYLKTLKLYQFKNYSDLKIDLHERINLVVGDNGMGKTNLLDAIYYLSFCRSNFQALDKYNVQHEQDGFRIEGVYDIDKAKEQIVVKLATGQKKEISRNSKSYERFSEHIGVIPLVIISPDDISAIIEGSEPRRKLIDMMLCQVDKTYFSSLIKYSRLLKQRNAYLKTTDYYAIDHKVLDTYDFQMLDGSEHIHARRGVVVEQLRPFLQEVYEKISGDSEQVSISYKSELNNVNVKDLFVASRPNDIKMRRTTRGVHRDDYELQLDDFAAKKYGSQGQIKSLIIALKLAQNLFLTEQKQNRPLLLLDDIFDKLDNKRVGNLLDLCTSDAFGQLFISDTEQERVSKILDDRKLDYHCHQVISGTVTK